ncbi:sorbosone dehydrogenase family protein [uncultured Ornithinimicrobium sp.]|uniref:PQQ-dependent sugar dehydrogenase n=1 Tax=uncultured Ornithinimicrobium sp. TaxID=259307 RepID=UPI0025970C6B|nr:PQQ-dependent sugar dehydrogenase [uncultured Ornithinimicrobium sp.]
MRPVRATAVLVLLGALGVTGCSSTATPDPGTGTTPDRSASPGPAEDATAGGGSDAATDDGGTADAGTTVGGATEDAPTTGGTTVDPAVPPELDVEVVLDGLAIPWDVAPRPDGTVLVTERGGRLLAHRDGLTQEVATDLDHLFASGEAGLMGLAVEEDTVYLCHAWAPTDGPGDVRVTAHTLTEDLTSAALQAVVVDGIPLTSGRHSGCRLLLQDDGTLLVGTGDAADEANPQDLDSLGGKVLHVRTDGGAADPASAPHGADPRILTYGHRNVQGLAEQPGTGEIFSVEHGPAVDDEVNVLEPGANYGWAPGPGYDEGVPMTDLERFPDAVEAVWSSGDPTHATSGAAFLEGEAWGAWEGALAVAELKGSGMTVLSLDGREVVDEARVPELEGSYGRLRSVVLDDDGALWVTTSNGSDDVVLRVTPRG